MSRKLVTVQGLTDGERSWVRFTNQGRSAVLAESNWRQLNRARVIRFKKYRNQTSDQPTHISVRGLPMDLTNAAWKEVLELLRDGLPKERQYLLLPPSYYSWR
jgi:hypothetical protein